MSDLAARIAYGVLISIIAFFVIGAIVAAFVLK